MNNVIQGTESSMQRIINDFVMKNGGIITDDGQCLELLVKAV